MLFTLHTCSIQTLEFAFLMPTMIGSMGFKYSAGTCLDSPAIRSEGSTRCFVCHLLWLCWGVMRLSEEDVALDMDEVVVEVEEQEPSDDDEDSEESGGLAED